MPSYNVMYPSGMTPSAAELLRPTLTDVTSVVKTSSALQRDVSLVPSLQLILGTDKMCTYKVRRQSIFDSITKFYLLCFAHSKEMHLTDQIFLLLLSRAQLQYNYMWKDGREGK